MRTILFLIQKEFLQISRNRGLLPIIFVAPVIQLLVLSYAADFEIRNLKLYWIDKDQSSFSRQLRSKFEGSPYFILTDYGFNSKEGEYVLQEDEADLVIEIPQGFEERLTREGKSPVQLVINAIDGTKAGLGNYYAGSVIGDFNQQIRMMYQYQSPTASTGIASIIPSYSFWFNPVLNYKTFMVPGILVLLVTMIGSFLSAMNVVREKEIGTIEQLNVTPIRKYQFIIGKLFPLWIIVLFEFSFGLLVARLYFEVPIVGSIALVYAFASVYMIMILGLGLFISTVTETQQQAMFIAWFFLVIFILMSGLFTAIENMPVWAQNITLVNPVRYFIEVIRMVMLKGADFNDIRHHFMVIALYGVVINALAVWRYRKTV